MQSIKESAANVAASAKSGIEKTKATVQEKVDKMTAKDPTEKEMATERKEERVFNAELKKQEAREQHAAAKMLAKNGGSQSFTGHRKVSALSKHNVGQRDTIYNVGQEATTTTTDKVIDGSAKFHPVTGTGTGTGTGSETGPNTRLGGGANSGYGSA